MKDITIVTAYIEIPKKKFSSLTYYNWIINYLRILKQTKIVIYTNSEIIINLINEIRKGYLEYTKIIKVNIEDLYSYKYIDYFNKDYERDMERYHDPLLYLIWNNKISFIYETYKKKYFETELYAWTDIGMIRNEETFEILKNLLPLNSIEKINKEKVYLLEVEKFKEEELNYKEEKPYKFTENRCGGGVILCSKENIEELNKNYYEMIDKFIENDIFSGKDQNILNNLYIKNKEKIELIEPKNSPFDKWFYMLYYMAI